MSKFAIYPIPLSSGTLAISPMPGISGHFEADVLTLLRWAPDLVLTMTTGAELAHAQANELPCRLEEAEIQWNHLPISDFGAPVGETAARWPKAARDAHLVLQNGGKVLAHCYQGQGRSGMAVMRLMVEQGISAQNALGQIRAVRPGAVETGAQRAWAAQRTG